MNKQTLIIEGATSITLDGVPMVERKQGPTFSEPDEFGRVAILEFNEFLDSMVSAGDEHDKRAANGFPYWFFIQALDYAEQYTPQQAQSLYHNSNRLMGLTLARNINFKLAHFGSLIYNADGSVDGKAVVEHNTQQTTLTIIDGMNGLLEPIYVSDTDRTVTGFKPSTQRGIDKYKAFLDRLVPYLEFLVRDEARRLRAGDVVVGGPAAPGGAG